MTVPALSSGAWLDITTWPRRAHYELFRAYEQPFWSVCTDVRVSGLHRRAHEPGGPSFFLASLFAALCASNATEEFRYRLRPEGVWRWDRIDIGSTVLRRDETFGFAYFAHASTWTEFERSGRIEAERASVATGPLDPQDERDDLVHTTVLPWIRLTGFAHARRHARGDSVPKIVFGKHFERAGERWLPVAVDVHHALADGLHVGRWLERFESELEQVAAAPPLDAKP